MVVVRSLYLYDDDTVLDNTIDIADSGSNIASQ